MLAAAAGIERGDRASLAALATLRFGVRIDQPGTRVRDFHTAHHSVTGKSMPLSERFYLADAVFVAALEGEHALLVKLDAALRNPVYPPFLGRRSCPPAGPIELGLHADARLKDVLQDVPWQASTWYRKRHRRAAQDRLTVIREADAGERGDTLRDQPLSFAAAHRRHALRSVVTTTVPVPGPPPQAVRHDPFEALEDESA
jgi:CRISPR system Cascade subunit CasD